MSRKMLGQVLNTVDLYTVLTFMLVLLLSYIIWNSFFSVRINIPGPTPWPIVGNIPNLVTARDVSVRFLEFHKKYGNMVLLRLGPQPFVVCFGYKLVREVLVANGEKTKFRPSWLHLVKKIFSDKIGIFFANGKEWSDCRKFTIVALKDFGIGKKTIDERINEEVRCLVEEFSKQPDKPVDVSKIFSMATSNVISNIVFGSRFEYDDPIFKEMLQHIYMIFKSATLNSPVNFFPIIDKITPSNAIDEVQGHIKAIKAYIRSRIDKQRVSFDPNNIHNFIDLYLEQEGKPDSKISEDCLLQIIQDIFQAGTDTTSVTLQWCMLYMLKYPDVQNKCRDEILTVLGETKLPGCKDRDHLPYVLATIREVQRLASVAPFTVPHALLEDTYIDGKLIPKKTILMCHIISVHKDPEVWDNPEEFRPERFLDGDGKLVNRDGFCPFSMGPRMCIGKQLADNEAFIIFTSFLQRFNFSKITPDAEVSLFGEQTGITRQPKPFEMRFKPR